jgi:hypothetical protein
MNKRIDQLLVKAGAVFGGEGVVYDTFDPKKFAEMIVRECSNVAWQHTPETEELEYSHLIKDKILERFGVKE